MSRSHRQTVRLIGLFSGRDPFATQDASCDARVHITGEAKSSIAMAPAFGVSLNRCHVRSRVVFVLISILLYASAALAQTVGPQNTIGGVGLSAAAVRHIIAAVEQSAYDVPTSWTAELRAKRVDLGRSPGLVLKGTNLLCGATGNCQLFVFRKVNGNWVSLFAGAQAPLAESFQFGPRRTHDVKDLIVETNSSAESGERATYQFDGRVYRLSGRHPTKNR